MSSPCEPCAEYQELKRDNELLIDALKAMVQVYWESGSRQGQIPDCVAYAYWAMAHAVHSRGSAHIT